MPGSTERPDTDASAEATAVSVQVTGRVQGVAYRWSTLAEAQRLGVCGWIGNEYDGSVRGHFEGDPVAVQSLVDWCHTGPPSARVRSVAVQPDSVEGLRNFTVRS